MPAVAEGEWVNGRGQKLFTLEVLPDAGVAPVAVLAVHHGYGEYVRRYDDVFKALAEQGIAVHAYDVHGHGRSEPADEPQRFLVHSFQHLVDDFAGFTARVRAQHPPSMPVFALGHSMGGLVAVEAVLRDQRLVSGLIISSPALYVQTGPVLKIQAALSKLLAAAAPNARLVKAVNPVFINREDALVAAYQADKMIDHGNMRVRTGRELLLAMRDVEHNERGLSLPVLAFHGSDDRITSPVGTRRLIMNCASADKTLHEVPDAYHELLMNPAHRGDLVDRIAAWIKQRSPTPKM